MKDIHNLMEDYKNESDPAKKIEILIQIESTLDNEIKSYDIIQKDLVQMSIDLNYQRDIENQSYLRPIRY